MSFKAIFVLIWIKNFVIVLTQTDCSQYRTSLAAKSYCPLFGDYSQYYYRPVVFTKAYQKTSSGITRIALQFDGKCYTKVLDLTPKDFPVISEEPDEQNNALLKYPNCFADWNPEAEGFEEYKDFEFDVRHGTYWKNKKMIGFNTEWLGCPQDLCLNGKIDTIYRTGQYLETELPFKLLRGRHVFEIDYNYKLKSSEPKAIDTSSLDPTLLTNASDWPKGYIEAMFHIQYGNEDMNYLIKGDKFWYSEADPKTKSYKPFSNATKLVDRFDSKFPSNIDSMIALDQFVYAFKDDQYWGGILCKDCPLNSGKFVSFHEFSGPEPVSKLHKNFPEKVNEILITTPDRHIHIFSDWNFYDLGYVDTTKGLEEGLKKDIEFKRINIFKKFGCSDESYKRKGFKDLNDYLKQIKIFNKLEPKNPLTNKMPVEVRTYYIIFGVIVVIMIGITLIVWFTLRQQKTQNIERQKQMNRIEAGIGANKMDKPLTNEERVALAKAPQKQEEIQSMIKK